jgi:hypothetical protein
MRPMGRPDRATVTSWAWNPKVLDAAAAVGALVDKQRADGIAADKVLDRHKFEDHWSGLKDALKRAQDGQCVWCSARPADGGCYGTVDHIRPKGEVGRDRVYRDRARRPSGRPSGERKPGYWWRAYDAENLALVCRKCNRNKGMSWPVATLADRSDWDDPTTWAAPALGVVEFEVALDPFAPGFDPAAHFDVLLDGSLAPRGGDLRAEVTIDLVCLNREDLTENRPADPEKVLPLLNALARAATSADPQAQADLTAHLRELARRCAWSTPHALAFRAALGSALQDPRSMVNWACLRALWDAHGLAHGVSQLPTII